MAAVALISGGMSLVSFVASRFIWQHKLFGDVADDIRVIKQDLMAMEENLFSGADAEEPGEEDKLHPTKAALRELCYEVDLQIDHWKLLCCHGTYYKDGIKKRIRKFSNMFPDKIHYQIAKDIKGNKRKLKEIIDGYERHKADACSSSRSIKVDPRVFMIPKDATELVGVDGPRHDLVNWLSKQEGESAHQQKVVSIVGCAGLGKTTLAKQVYNKLVVNFEYRVFVSVSHRPNMAKIFKSILSQLHNRDYSCNESEVSELITQITEFLQDKRYFMILDDVWDVQTWQILKCALCQNSCGSAIMTTTRMYDVAKSCCSSSGDLVYKMQPLSVADSERLLLNGVFGWENEFPPNLKEASKYILKTCGGLPLAINSISRLLASKPKEEWDHVGLSSVFVQGKKSDIDALKYILSLSYFDLPPHLASCLLYLTMFPEDYLLERKRLVQRWISEGFIHGEDGKDLVEVGERFLYELVSRSLIESVGVQYDGKARFYRVHNVILYFLILSSTKENFCTLLLNNPSKPDPRVHRLSLFGNENPSCIAQLDLSHARSLSASGNLGQLTSSVKSNALHVLDLQDCSELGTHHVKDIGRNPLLRYLNISGTDITELPIQIGDMEFLETLDASFTELVDMPGSITCLRRLQRLFVSDETKLPDEIGNMYSLQELGDINAFNQSVNFLNELGKLMYLRRLSIVWDTNGILRFGKRSYKEKKLVSSLCKLDQMSLRTLCVTFYLREKDGFIGQPFLPALNSIREVYLRCGRMCWINKWLLSLANLEKLCISGGDEIEQDDLHTVGSIPTLVEFKLYSGCLGPIIISSGFQQLERLELKFSFSQLMFEVGAMPNLKKLDLHVYLSKLKSVGAGFEFGIQHLSSLAFVSIVIFCEGVGAAYVEAAEEAFKSMVKAHPNPNRPILEMSRESADFMSQDE